MNFDSGRRIRRLERAKKRGRRKDRWSPFKRAQEAQRRNERFVAMGVIG